MVPDRVEAFFRELFEVNGRQSAALNAALVFALILGVAGVGYTVVAAEGTHQYTEFYLLAEDDSGELYAQDYPGSIVADEPTTFHVGIQNNEGSPGQYTVVVKLQRMYFENGTAEVLEEERLESTYVPVPDDGKVIREVDVTPSLRGSQMRLVFLLYQDDPPADPSMQNAYQVTHLWVDITPPSNGETDSNALDRAPNDSPRSIAVSVAAH